MQKKPKINDRIYRIMRITGMQLLVAVFFSGMALAHTNHAQEILNREVSLQLKEATMEEVLNKISAVTKVKFVYSPAFVEASEKISVEFSKQKLGDVLRQLLTARNLEFNVQQGDDFIIISRVKVKKKTALHETPEAVNVAVLFAIISGRVTDPAGIPMPGVNVVVKESQPHVVISNSPNADVVAVRAVQGTVTDADGQYAIDANPGDVLSFSSIGYKPIDVPVYNNTVMDVVMQEDITTLSEVIVNASYSTGYQVLPKERATGSYAKPNMDVFKDRASTLDVMSRLEGQVAGLTLNMGIEGRAGYSRHGLVTRRALIRGKSSVNLESEPLYVLNGVPVTNYADINPDDIADITVLKDAAATAIWGARAANGVIVVTTKTGKKDDRIRISYSAFASFQGKQDYSYSKMMNSQQYIQAARETFDPVAYPVSWLSRDYIAPHEKILYDQHEGLITSEQADARLDSLAAIDNVGQIKDIYRQAYTTNHTISIAGGGSLYSFYSSISYADTHSNVPGEKNNAYRINFNQDFTPHKNIKISLSTNLNKSVSGAKNSFDASTRFLPYQLFRDADGNSVNINYLTGWSEEQRLDFQSRSRVNLEYNPLKEWNYRHSENKSIGVNMVANIGIRLWKGLSYLGTYGYTISPNEYTSYEDYKTLSMRKRLVDNTVASTVNDIPVYHLPTTGGRYMRGLSDQRDWTVRNQLTYIATPRNHKDNLTVQAGLEARENLATENRVTMEGYNEDLQTYALLDYNLLRQGIPGTVTGWGGYYEEPFQISEKKMRFTSRFALANYTISQRYSVDVSWRQDHSNLFGSDQSAQNKPVWSVGGKWRLSQENFMKSVAWANDLSLRATYGVTGNSPYVGAASSQDILYTKTFPGISGPELQVGKKANKTLNWETTETINIGIDFGLLKNRVNGSINLYHKDTRDMLGKVELNPFTSEATGLGNLGHLVNKGIELQLYTSNLTIKDFNWSSGFVFSYNKNELVSFEKAESFQLTDYSKLSANYWVDYPMSPLFAYRWVGLDNMGDPQITLADGTVTKQPNVADADDLVYMGTTTPVFNGGITNTFRYKGWQLTLNLVYSLGHVMRRDVNRLYSERMTASSGWGGNVSVYFQDRWRKPGDENITNVPSYVPGYESYSRRSTNYYANADINVVSASYAKLRDITLSYTLPARVLNTLRLDNVRIFAQTNNVMVWKANKYSIDPELNALREGGRGQRFAPGLSIGVNASF